MFAYFLADSIEHATLDRVHHVQAVIIREREVPIVLCYTFPREFKRRYAIHFTTAGVVDILRRIEQRGIVSADPSVHEKSPTRLVVDPT